MGLFTRRMFISVIAGSAYAHGVAAQVAKGSRSASVLLPGDVFFKGFNIGYLAKAGYYSSDKGMAAPEGIAKTGSDWVTLIVMVMQDHFYSTRMYRDFTYTATDIELEEIVKEFHNKGVRVMLKPMLDIHDGGWRGYIRFPAMADQQIQGVTNTYWIDWFASLESSYVYYARLAEMFGVDALSVGSELTQTYRYVKQWKQIIDNVRHIYSGLVTTAGVIENLENPLFQGWFSDVDLIGVSFYVGVPEIDNPSVEQVKAALSKEIERFRKVSEKIGKRIYWSECGIRSVNKGAVNPADYQNGGEFNGKLQANYIQGMLETFQNEKWWAGYQYWKWDEQQVRPQYQSAGGDTGFTIQGKPVEAVLTKWNTSR